MIDEEALLQEVEFQAVSSSGPGGQHANRASTKVTLTWTPSKSRVFSDTQLKRIQKNLSSKFTKDGKFILSSEKTRSQHQNKEIVTQKFLNRIRKALKPRKKRKKTKPTKASKRKRLQKKRKQSEKKQRRKGPEL